MLNSIGGKKNFLLIPTICSCQNLRQFLQILLEFFFQGSYKGVGSQNKLMQVLPTSTCLLFQNPILWCESAIYIAEICLFSSRLIMSLIIKCGSLTSALVLVFLKKLRFSLQIRLICVLDKIKKFFLYLTQFSFRKLRF